MTMPNDDLKIDEALMEDDLELARKLAAAYIAHRAGHKSVDYARKRYVDSGEIGAEWIELARIVKEKIETALQRAGDIPMLTTRTQ